MDRSTVVSIELRRPLCVRSVDFGVPDKCRLRPEERRESRHDQSSESGQKRPQMIFSEPISRKQLTAESMHPFGRRTGYNEPFRKLMQTQVEPAPIIQFDRIERNL